MSQIDFNIPIQSPALQELDHVVISKETYGVLEEARRLRTFEAIQQTTRPFEYLLILPPKRKLPTADEFLERYLEEESPRAILKLRGTEYRKKLVLQETNEFYQTMRELMQQDQFRFCATLHIYPTSGSEIAHIDYVSLDGEHIQPVRGFYPPDLMRTFEDARRIKGYRISKNTWARAILP